MPDARRQSLRRAGLAGVAVLMAGCTTVGPNFTRPDAASAPAGYAMAGDPVPAGVRLDPDGRVAGPWWTAFGSDALDQTIRLALAQSPDVERARAVLDRSQAAEQAVRGDLGPQLSASADVQRQKFNSKTFGFSGFPSLTFNLWSVGSTVSYDLDVFGGGRRRAEEAGARAEQAARQADAAYLSLTGSVALQAIRIAGLREQIAAAGVVVEDDRRLLEIARRAEALGGMSSVELIRMESQLADDEAVLAPLQRQYDAARHQLALLVGKSPAEWSAPDFALASFSAPAQIPVSAPSSLVRQRPDILAAEAELHAATAAVGVATANQYPDVRLSAKGAFSNPEVGELIDTGSTGWNLFSGVTAPIFDGGARKARTRAAEADARAALARYRQTVLQAFTQVSDVLAALETDRLRLEALERGAEAGARDTASAESAERAGGASRLRALQARRELDRKQRDLAEARARLLSDMAELYVASAADWREAPAAGGPRGVSTGH